MFWISCGCGCPPSSPVAQECGGWLGVAVPAQREPALFPQGARGGAAPVPHGSRYAVERVPAAALLGHWCCQPFPSVSCLSRHHKFCVAVANWAFGRILYNWVSAWIIHTYALLKLEKFWVLLYFFSVASWSDWLLMSLCIFSQHKLFLNSFLNAHVNSHK